MSGFEARLERLELKYLIDELAAERIRRDVALYCEPDSHSARGGSGGARGYAISSLYLDSPGLAFHHAKERGDPERLKLRVRTYGGDSPAILEIKRRHADVIDKRRAGVPRNEVEQIVDGFPPAGDADLPTRRLAQQFARLVAEHGAAPCLRVRYRREAWVSNVDDYARVTFDRRIEAKRTTRWSRTGDPGPWCAFDDHWASAQGQANVVLELKCHSSVPLWITDLVRRHRLKRTSFSKYSIGIVLTDREAGLDSLLRRSAKVMR